MHIRILAGLLDRTAGSHVYHVELATRLARRGHRVSVVCFRSEPNLPFETIEIPRRGAVPLVWRFRALTDYLDLSHRLQQIPLSRPDITIGGEHLFLRAHARRFTAPWIYLPHSLLLEHEFDGYRMTPTMARATLAVYSRLQGWALRTADRTLRFTQYGCDVLRRRRGQARYVVNPIGVDLPDLLPKNSQPVRVLSIGSLSARKRMDVALRALAGVKDVPWHADIVGGGDVASLRRLAGELGISERVTLHGHQDDVRPFYRNADIFLLASASESLGLVVVEAMSYGLPVVAMQADGLRYFNPFAEVLGEAGFLAAEDAGLASYLRRLLSDRALLAGAAERARRRAESTFSWDGHLDRYDALFAELAPAAR